MWIGLYREREEREREGAKGFIDNAVGRGGGEDLLMLVKFTWSGAQGAQHYHYRIEAGWK